MILSVFILQMNLVISLQLATAAKWGVGLPSKFVVFNILQIISIPSHFQSSQNRKPLSRFLCLRFPPWENPRRIPASQPPMIFPTVHLLGRCEFWRHRRWGRVSRVASGKQPRCFFTLRDVKQSPLLIGNSSINCGFSIAMLVDMMFTWCLYDNYDSELFFYCLLQCLSTEGSSES